MDFNFDTGTISSILELDPGSNNITVMGTSGVVLPIGTVADRIDATGAFRFNSELGYFEGFDGVKWTTVQITNANLTSLSNLNGTGFVVQTGVGTFAERFILPVSGQTIVTNSGGVAGNVTVGLANAGVSGTYVVSTTDQFGRVISGNTVQSWTTIVDTPTTLAGYGITDAITGNTGVSSWSAGLLADRPATADTGAMYYATDTSETYYYNGSSWALTLPALGGDVSSVAGNAFVTLNTVNSDIGTYGSATAIPIVTVNSKGLVTAVNTVSISGSISVTGGDLTMSGSTGTSINNATLNNVNSDVGFFGSNAAVATFTVNAKGLVTSAANVNITPEAIGAVNVNLLATANGVATLGPDGTLSSDQIPPALVGALQYAGVWDAATNSPTLVAGVGVTGQYYKVNVAGSTSIDGNNNWAVGDMIVFNGTTWDGIDGLTTEVTSVFGRVGAVTATLASSDFADQGTTTTVLHGNANGAPSWGAINLSSDITGILPATSFPVLSGDISTTTGNTVTTLATVNSDVGMYGDSTNVAQVTVNGKGLVTAVSNVAIPLAVTIGGDATGSGTTSTTANITLNTVNSNVGTFGSATSIPVVSVNSKGLVTGVSTASISGDITLVGDATGSGTTGSNTSVTLNTVNGNVGQFGDAFNVPQITVNAKGLVTAVSNVIITAAGTGAVANAGNVPSMASETISNIPAAGNLGAVFIATDTHAIYRDDGTAWVQIGESSVLYTENPVSPVASTVTGNNAVSIGSNNVASGTNTMALGAGASAVNYGSMIHANGSFSSAGDAQTGKYVLRTVTSTVNPTEAFLDGSSARITLPNMSAMAYQALIVGRRIDQTGSEAAFKIEGLISRDANAASTTLVGSRSKTVLTRPAGWDAEVYADTSNGALTFKVTGSGSVRWVVTVTTSEVTQ